MSGTLIVLNVQPRIYSTGNAHFLYRIQDEFEKPILNWSQDFMLIFGQTKNFITEKGDLLVREFECQPRNVPEATKLRLKLKPNNPPKKQYHFKSPKVKKLWELLVMISQPLVLFGDESMNPQFEQRPTGPSMGIFFIRHWKKRYPQTNTAIHLFHGGMSEIESLTTQVANLVFLQVYPPQRSNRGLLHCGSSSLSRRFSRTGLVLLLCGITLGATLPVFDTMRVEFMSLGGRWCGEICASEHSEKLT